MSSIQTTTHWMMRTALVATLAIPVNVRAQSTPEFDAIADRVSSSGLMKPQDLRILMDNRKAFEEKLDNLREAQSGDHVYAIYYIHSNDETTSLYNQEVIAAARRGVKVHIMADFLTNYKRLDMFNMMQKEAGGSLDIRFFNPPTAAMQHDIMYMTSNCLEDPAHCRDEKDKQVAEAEAKGSPEGMRFFRNLFVAGLSGKSPAALKLALFTAGTIPDLKNGSTHIPSEDEKKQLMEFAKIMFGAKVLRTTLDRMKLSLAMVMYGEDVRPIYEAIEKAVPLSAAEHDTNSGKDWEDSTKFTHHKATARFSADGRSMKTVTGGRNLENSYHLNEDMRSMVEKYLFYDTDVVIESKDREGIAETRKAFEELFNFKELVVTLDEVNRALPVDLIAEIETVKSIVESTKALKEGGRMSSNEYANLVAQRFAEATKGRAEARQRAEFDRMQSGARSYEASLQEVLAKPTKAILPEIVESMDPKDKAQARVAYLENLPFRESTRWERVKAFFARLFGRTPQTLHRVYQPIPGNLEASNKNIHVMWYEWLKREAAAAAAKKEVRTLYIHQGYVFLPADMVKTLSMMIDGTIDASYINLKFMSNSIQTTDLSPMNMLARHQLKALYDYYDQFTGRPRALRGMEIYEYNVLPDGNKSSLHTKAMVGPDSMFVMSANADVRSSQTDTNNAMFIENVPRTAAKMQAHLEGIARDSRLMTNVTKSFGRAHSDFLHEDIKILGEIASKYKKVGERLNAHQTEISKLMIQQMTQVYLMSGMIADPKAEEWLGRTSLIERPDPIAAPSMRGQQVMCDKVLLGTDGSTYMNTRPDMIEAIRKMRSKYKPQELRATFDRIWMPI